DARKCGADDSSALRVRRQLAAERHAGDHSRRPQFSPCQDRRIVGPTFCPPMNPLPLDPQNTRRDFLKKLSAASVAAMMAREPRLFAADPVKQPKPKADSCILLWMAGGMAAPETFDPKRYEAFEAGKPVERVL